MEHIDISNLDVVRAWKDEEYRNSLTEEQRAQLPENPAGLIDLTEEDIISVIQSCSKLIPKQRKIWQAIARWIVS